MQAISVWRRRAVAQVPYGSAHESIGCITAALELRKDSLELLLLRAALHIAWGDLAAAVRHPPCASLATHWLPLSPECKAYKHPRLWGGVVLSESI